jgi:hypothetical protein
VVAQHERAESAVRGIVVVAVALLLGNRTRAVNAVPDQAVPD